MLSPDPSQQTHSIGTIIPILLMVKPRPGGARFSKVTQLITGKAKPPNLALSEAKVHASNHKAPHCLSTRHLAQRAFFGNCEMLLKNT